MLLIYIMANIGGMSMRPGLPAVKPFTRREKRLNYVVGVRTRKTGLIGGSGTLNNNV